MGWNVLVGGGMGMTHGEPETYPKTAEIMAFCRPEQAVDVAEKVLIVQRDFGDRTNRKHARLKYTVDDHGVAWYRAEVERRLGYPLEDPRPMRFDHTGDRYGWAEDASGNWHYTLYIENGRVKDTPERPMRTGLRKIAEVLTGEFRLTPNQNLTISNIAAARPQADRGAPARARPRPTTASPACASTAWPAWRCRPAAWRWPRASATCRA